MRKHFALPALSIPFLVIAAGAAPTGKWVEVRSRNFIVVSNAGEGQARKVDLQFERVRSLFRESLPYAKAAPSPVITILAVKDEDSLRELLPEYWEKGRAHPAGIFLGGSYDQFQIALNVSAHGDNPYESLYHEYYHSLTVPYFPGLPVWVAEGMADFYGNSTIGDKDANVGMPNAPLIEQLRSTPLIPLSTLFKVDHNSPYYNEQNKVSIFYAESWALIHYLMLGDNRGHKALFAAYLAALNDGANQDEAAAKAFGDLGKFQESLARYIERFSFPYVEVPAPAKIPESDFASRPLSAAEIDAYSGGFLAFHRQFQAAEVLLKEASQLDPKLALAQRNLAFLHFYRDERMDALAALSAAIALDPQDPITHYLRAQTTFDDVSHSDPQIEADLRQAIALKPDFAPANGLLSVYLSSSGDKLPEALALAQKAVTEEPGNVYFQIALIQVLARMRRYDEAETLGRRVRANATDMNARSAVDNVLTYVAQARDYETRERKRQEEEAARAAAMPSRAQAEDAAAQSAEPPAEKISEPAGPVNDPNAPILKRRTPATDVVGVIVQVRCNGGEMEVTAKLPEGAAPLIFHAKDRARVGYTSNVPAIHEDIDPCTELRGHSAKLIFTSSAVKWYNGELVHIEIEK